MEATTTPTTFIREGGVSDAPIIGVTLVAEAPSRWKAARIALPDGNVIDWYGHLHASPEALLASEAKGRAIAAMCAEQGYGLGRYTGD